MPYWITCLHGTDPNDTSKRKRLSNWTWGVRSKEHYIIGMKEKVPPSDRHVAPDGKKYGGLHINFVDGKFYMPPIDSIKDGDDPMKVAFSAPHIQREVTLAQLFPRWDWECVKEAFEILMDSDNGQYGAKYEIDPGDFDDYWKTHTNPKTGKGWLREIEGKSYVADSHVRDEVNAEIAEVSAQHDAQIADTEPHVIVDGRRRKVLKGNDD